MATMSFVASCIAALPAGAQWWNPQSPIAPGKWEAESRTFVYTRNIYSSAVQVIIAAVQQGDFAKLDRMHDEFLKMTQAGGNGSRMINAFQEALSTFGKDHLERQQAFLKAWHAGAPTSKLWPAAQAQMWFSAAWDERGGGFASEVSPEAMRLFGQDLERASQALQEGGDAARQSPLWYAVAIAVAGSRGEGSRSLDALFEEGVKRFPHFTLQYNARLIYLLPQWGGSYDRADAFIRRAVMDTQADDGTWMYADLYASAGRMVQGDFFRDTRASWPLMRHAFEDASARGLANPNTYATYACMARDRETTRRLLGELGTYANLGMGRDTFTTESCRAMVEEGK
ncbi:MAG TPA: hypothetical protein VKR38_12795 [Usitatibacter sp.]|nr:hypothetical protein [Usitatibacter sp.]